MTVRILRLNIGPDVGPDGQNFFLIGRNDTLSKSGSREILVLVAGNQAGHGSLIIGVDTMKTEKFSFNVETFQGEDLNPPVQITGEVQIPETREEAKDVWPNDATILDWLQSDILTRAKSKARADGLSTHMETYRKSDAFREKQAIASFRALLGDAVKNLSDAEILERAKALGTV